jgi:hypothetical protein
MELSGKALRHVSAAVQERIAAYERELAATDLSEDARSELVMDQLFLEAILSDMQAELEGRPKGRRSTEPGHG